jgi:hypothetical protein
MVIELAECRMSTIRTRDAEWVAALREAGLELPEDAAPRAAGRALREGRLRITVKFEPQEPI